MPTIAIIGTLDTKGEEFRFLKEEVERRGVRALPISVPKVMITTLASGNTRPYVDIADVTMMYPVVDIAGLNRISRQVIRQGAAAVVAMAEASQVSGVGGQGSARTAEAYV